MCLPAKLIDRLRSAQKVTVVTGAGISAESGVPTFRDAQTGMWSRFKPEDLATPEAFVRNPRLVWEWYAERRRKIGEVEPNPGHYALAEMERRIPVFTLVTQNVDGLHQRAGSRLVCELHGNIARVKCFEEDKVVEQWEESGEMPPRCPRCGGRLRPDVVWFGEMLPADAIEAGEIASAECEIFFSVGTSAQVYPAAGLAHTALNAGALVVEVNPDFTPLTTRAHFVLRGRSGAVLPTLVKAVWPP